ncbi:alpha/beta hydrolase [Stackebrandtia nassauensis]|uniref:DUF1023 domain-containing protein n=1 Tax=Stackebrandtia nassauensis (strain DSM 44728 / CIP 108903 / NRRL B-16338 / NBRC 102104 / LLR-40K-21) TaxID=446470 RepID=D3Q8Q0_STANL|nr:alpha/beta hydrolase [Stackebrandtia nassauensis]ADD44492.1 protein of unknown function DUF1023 [Stackebrandtia nassauensis DSM 44728]
MAWERSWRGVAACGVAVTVTAALVTGSVSTTTPAHADVGLIADAMAQGRSASLAEDHLPSEYTRLGPAEAAAAIAKDPRLASERAEAVPAADAADPLEAGLAKFKSILDTGGGVRDVARAYRELPAEATRWLAAVFPGVIGNLNGAALSDRIAANRIRAAAVVAGSRAWPSPTRPWTEADREPRRDYSHLLDAGRQLIYFDPAANQRMGSWVEVRGELDTADYVAVLVPGGSAFITTGEPGGFAASGNFGRYSARADSFVEAADGELAVIVWAQPPSPSGWVDEADPSWAQDAAPRLVEFMDDLNRQLDDRDVAVTVAGHSYGGAVVGLAEVQGFDADRVLHVASAGAGYGVTGPGDYQPRCRERYSMMAPGDPISYVQDIPAATGLGHGAGVHDLPGVVRLETGYLPDDPQAPDDVGRTLGSQGITGKRISGIHAHSEVFIPDSGAWRNMLAVFSMVDPRPAATQPPRDSQC